MKSPLQHHSSPRAKGLLAVALLAFSHQYLRHCFFTLPMPLTIRRENDEAIYLQRLYNSAKTTLSQLSRSERFPSVEERIKIYMGAWYQPPLPTGLATKDFSSSATLYEWNGDKSVLHLRQSKRLSSFLHPQLLTLTVGQQPLRQDELIILDRQQMLRCLEQQEFDGPVRLHTYCRDVLASMPVNETFVGDLVYHEQQLPPLLAHFGDKWKVLPSLRLPHFAKYRPAFSHDEWQIVNHGVNNNCCKYLYDYPILWKLNTKRHFGLLEKVAEKDIPWEDKTNRAIFWGTATGLNDWQDILQDDNVGTMSEYEKCMLIPRCRLVHQSAHSPLITAKLTKTRSTVLNETIDGVALVGPRIQLNVYLQHKAIIILEGNDVASALKWALYSNSVVLMPRPKYSSWSMEERLVPWVHYVPLTEDLSNAEACVQWIIHHDAEAQSIAERGRLWIHDLLYHEDSKRDNKRINQEIIRLYRAHFRKM